ncbi:hypothetical protein, partial [Lysobacter capsici]|uniref:hypothetical protein n=1 Tax=Lysobacter capsici TaxID=435897 RepID=UPI00398D0245
MSVKPLRTQLMCWMHVSQTITRSPIVIAAKVTSTAHYRLARYSPTVIPANAGIQGLSRENA